MRIGTIAAAAVAGLCCALAGAQHVTPTSSVREIYVEAIVIDSNAYSSGFDSDVSRSENLYPFNRKLDRFLSLGLQNVTMFASQNSAITPTGVNAVIVSDETVNCPSPGMTFGYSRGLLDTTYTVTRPTRYRLNATLTVLTEGTGNSCRTDVALTGQDGAVFSVARTTAGQSVHVLSGVIPPGTYRVRSTTDASTQIVKSPITRRGRAVADFTLSFACLADFDSSGFVDTDDYTEFVAAFDRGDPEADIDLTGFVDTDDFTAFVTAFIDAC